MRDRLKKIIDSAKDKYLNLLPFESMLLADHLLANGVICPPCKVGDTVYFILENEGKEEIFMDIVKGIEDTRYSDTYFEIKKPPTIITMVGRIPYEFFGKGVFLSREDAEKALEEANHGC